MRCSRHGLATGPDGRCALCRSRFSAFMRAGERSRDPVRKVAIVVVAILAGIAAYALIAAAVDTEPPRTVALDAGKP
jgi:hypothetical protein